jgi:hypothetical protein
MKKIRLYITLSLTLLITTICGAQISFKTIQKDFDKLAGTWEGSLTYLDYSSGKPYAMPANLEVKRIDNTSKLVFSNIYPNETSANSVDTISISTDGKYIDKELVKSRRKLPSGDIEIITEEFGKDGNDNKPATFRYTYTFGPTTYKNRKDVQFTGETVWINRHEYSYKKTPSR